MSAQPSPHYQNNREEEYARWRRRDHSNIEAMQNLAIAEIAKEKSTEEDSAEMPPNVRHMISALQGSHGGGEVAFEEFSRDYLTIGKQLQFTGTEDAIRARVRRWIDDLDSWQFAVGFELFTVRKGGQVIGTRPDGSPIRKATVFIDHLKPKADEAVQRARRAPLWKEHPGRALEEQVEWLKSELPKLGAKEESGKGGKSTTRQPLHEYEQKQEERIESTVEKVAGAIELRGGNGAEWVDRLANNLYRLAASLKKTERARRDYASLSIFDDEPAATDVEERSASATAYTCDIFDTPEDADLGNANVTQAGLGDMDVTQENAGDFEDFAPLDSELDNTDVTQSPGEQSPAQELDDARSIVDEDSMMSWALFWADQGIPIFPVESVYDCVCTCPCNKECKDGEHKCGSECESKGKHPIARLAPSGSISATTDPEIIRRWWREVPNANIGGRMGGALRILGVDTDPRAGGDASFHDLVEAHGDEWTSTLRHKSGGGGFHLFFTLPEGVEFRKKKLAPGIDLKWQNGYVVLPPSLHFSGARYLIADVKPIRPAPDWLVEELTRKPDQPPAKVIQFQEQKDRFSPVGSQEKFYQPGRNDGLFGVGFGRWVNGWAADVVELHAQLLEVNAARCVPPLADSEVAKMSAHIAADYPRGILRGEAGGVS